MPIVKTYGRNPTLREVKEYYAREDVLAFLNYACRKRRVIFSFKDEPSLSSEKGTPPLAPQSIENLHQIVTGEIEEKMQGMADDARPRACPSFHFMTSRGDDVFGDFVMEADCHGWRRSFADVRGAIEIMNDFGVPYIAKFSGHRSLHVLIPREAFPDKSDGTLIAQSWQSLERKLRDFFNKFAYVRYAHGTGGILRLPYSLNENTGMVSLPIPHKEMDDFRPWEAIPHLVDTISQDLLDITAGDRDRMSQFLQAALIEKRISPLKSKMWVIQPKKDYGKYHHLMEEPSNLQAKLNSDNPTQRAEAAWYLMVSRSYIPEETFQRYPQERSSDVRWFIAEALMGDERASELLYETDEYAAASISDSVSLAPVPFLEKLLSGDRDWMYSFGVTINIHAICERVAELLKGEIMKRSEAVHEDKALILLRCAYILGSAVNDWDTVIKVTATMERRFPGMTDAISQDIPSNIMLLQSDDWRKANEAEKALIAAGTKATELLMLTVNADHVIRKRVISVLCRIGDPKAIPALVNALGDPNGRIRRMATTGILRLEQKPKELRELLVEAAKTDNPKLQANATKILGLIDKDTALGVALRSLEDRDWRVRQAAVKSLGKTGGSQSVEGLKRSLADENIDVAMSAAFALTDTGDAGKAILREALKDDRAQTARCAAHALAESGDNSGIDLVVDSLNDDGWDAWGTPFTLAKSGGTQAIEALLEFVGRSLHTEAMPQKALQSVRALGKRTDSRAVEMLKKVMYARRDRKARRPAVTALREMGTAESLNVLLDALVCEDGNLRQHAGNALISVCSDSEDARAPILLRLEELAEQLAGKPQRTVVSVLERLKKGE